MIQLLRQFLVVAAALGIALGPLPRAHADSTITINGIPFTIGSNGCVGPLVAVYGSSSLKNYILATAEDYCNY